jgi:predicted Zn finger-like uncharacterized protein
MLIVCPSCATSYDVDAGKLPAGGRQVRCVRCRTVWRATAGAAEPSRAERLLAAAEAIAPGPSGPFGEPPEGEFPVPDPASGYPGAAEADGGWGQPAGDHEHEQPADQAWDAAPPTAVGAAEAAGTIVEVAAPPIAPVDLDLGRDLGRTLLDVDHDHPAAPAAEPIRDIESYAGRSVQRRPTVASLGAALRWPLTRMQSVVLVLLIFDAIIFGWRVKIVRALPQTASFYAALGMPVNLRGLVFANVDTATEQHEGVPILVVEGNVVNDTRGSVDVPRLKFAVRNGARQEVYSWTAVPTKAVLRPGEALAFHTRLASPPPDGQDVLVRFLNRRDILAGAR